MYTIWLNILLEPAAERRRKFSLPPNRC